MLDKTTNTARPHLATLVGDFHRHGRQTAIVTYRGNRRVATSYAQLAILAERFAAELHAREIHVGDRVILWGQNGWEWVASFFGCVLRGVLAVPLDAAGGPGFARRVMDETRPRLIVADEDLLRGLDDDTPRLTFSSLESALPHTAAIAEPSLNLDTPLQILFTSGTTAEPKGIVHTHRNVLASLAPIEREIGKYQRYERLVHPLRFLHTLPLSHVFGQFMGLWVPPLLAAEVHFESRLQAQHLIERTRRERISVLAAVPRVLALLRTYLLAEHASLTEEIQASRGESIWRRWWRFRRIHRQLGLKFWAIVCGGASLQADIEDFWSSLGLALIQGYGMTETAALITLNHPFRIGKGTVGKPLPGREIRITDEGELQVRGEMVSTSTWQGGKVRQRADPWLATGDFAKSDAEGNLKFLGRKNQVIVTGSGLNVHPEDVEAALTAQPGVQAAAVVPFTTAAGTEPAAALLFRGITDQAQQAVIAANAQLADYQRVRHWKLWPDLEFPRTSTGKLQRRKVEQWMNSQRAATTTEPNSDPLIEIIRRLTGADPSSTSDSARLDEDLHLDSLGRVQLQAELEQRLGVTLGDAMLEQATTLGDLRRQAGIVAEEPANVSTAQVKTTVPGRTSYIYPRWPWSPMVRGLRIAFIECVVRPLVAALAAPRVDREAFTPRDHPPLLLIANHVSTFDVPLILYALPPALRRNVAVAMVADMLDDWRRARRQGSWLLNILGPLEYLLVTALFNVFPLPRTAGFRRSFQHAGEALDRGYNVLVFPEGRRSAEGTLQEFRSGIGLLALESGTQVLPIALAGLGPHKQKQKEWFRSGSLHVKIGKAVTIDRHLSPEEITARLHETLGGML